MIEKPSNPSQRYGLQSSILSYPNLFRLRQGLSIATLTLAGIFISTCIFILKSALGGPSTSYSGNSVNFHELDPNQIPNSNSTLGFQKLIYINIPGRYNRDDTISLQSVLTGITPFRFVGEHEKTLNTKGLPPSREPAKNGKLFQDEDSGDFSMEYVQALPITKTEKAVYRSHGNVWREIIQNDWTTALIIEADSMWDMNVKQMMHLFGHGLRKALVEQKLVSQKEVDDVEMRILKNEPVNDPYFSQKWDIIHLGSCKTELLDGTQTAYYYDPFVAVYNDPDKLESTSEPAHLNGVVLNNNTHHIHFNSKEECTTAYAVSRRGAQRLLLNMGLEMTAPIDKAIQQLTMSGNLRSVSAHPPVFAQWNYAPGLAQESKNSDVEELKDLEPEEIDEANSDADTEVVQKAKHDKEVKDKAWENVYNNHQAWSYGKGYENKFRQPVLLAMKKYFYADVEEEKLKEKEEKKIANEKFKAEKAEESNE